MSRRPNREKSRDRGRSVFEEARGMVMTAIILGEPFFRLFERKPGLEWVIPWLKEHKFLSMVVADLCNWTILHDSRFSAQPFASVKPSAHASSNEALQRMVHVLDEGYVDVSSIDSDDCVPLLQVLARAPRISLARLMNRRPSPLLEILERVGRVRWSLVSQSIEVLFGSLGYSPNLLTETSFTEVLNRFQRAQG